MRLTLLGATGETGQELIKQALEKKYHITALVRDRLPTLHPGIDAMRGNVFNLQTVKKAIEKSDAVVSVLGFTPTLFGEKSTDLYSKSASSLVKAMNSLGKKRLIFVTSAGVENDPHEIWLYKHILKPVLLEKGYQDMRFAEHIIRHSELDWTIVRPSRLTNGKLTAQFDVSPKYRTPGGSTISRADVAHFILDQLNDAAWLYQTPTLTTRS